MKIRNIFLIIVFLFQHVFCFSQSPALDSLLLVLKTAKSDTTKVNTLNNLFLEYEFDDEAKAKECLVKALDLAIKCDFKKGEAITYMYFGFFADDQSNYSESLKNYFLCLKAFESINNKKGMANAYNSIGAVFYAQGNYAQALQHHFSSLKLREFIGDTKGVASSYGNIGNVYNDQGNYPKALKNYFSCLFIMKGIDNKKGVATTYNNIALVYAEQHNYREALSNHFASLNMRKEIGDEKGVASSYNNIGLVYFYQEKYDEAKKYYLISLKMKEIEGNKALIAGQYCNLGEVFSRQDQYQQARAYLTKAKTISEEIGYRENLRNIYFALAELDGKTKDFKGAFNNYKLFVQYRDSLNNEDTKAKIIQNQLTYDFEKKEEIAVFEHKKELQSQQELAEEKSRKQKMIIGFVALVLIIVVAFAALIFRSLNLTRKQKKIIELQKNYVEKQKQEVEHQKLLVEEKQKEIIDSITYAKRLQKAILPSDEQIKKHLQNSFVFYQPKDIVAGDFYWLHESVNQNKETVVFVAAADSTGHGVPGAMVSVVCSNALNRAVNEFNLLDTGKILDKTRELVLQTFAKSGEEIKDGMDISIMSINKATNKINWSGANNQLLYISNNELIEIKADKQSIGKTDNPKPFKTHVIEMKCGDSFYLITDGYSDQFGGPKGKKFKYKKLQENLITTNNSSLFEQKEYLENLFNEWKGDLEQVDDVTIIGIRI